VGAILAGKYRVERVLGVGGMGAVIAATHIDLDEIRAIKLMHASESENSLAVERFLREARAAVKLKSEHIARVYDVGRLETGVPYIVMEYLEGNDLSRIARKQGPLPIAEVVHYILQACDAIAEAHAAGIVHRDLKPANLFLTRRDDGSACIKVLDFGISKLSVPGAAPDLEITTGNEVLGSPHYMSPEQMRATRNADERSDVWSLGAIMYRLITGRLPFPAETPMELATRILETVPERPSVLRPEVQPALEQAILRCLEKDPARRTQNATELATSLLPFAPLEALETLPLSRRLALSLAPPRASLASIPDARASYPSIPIAPGLPSLGGDAVQGTWPSLPTPAQSSGTETSSSQTSWGATGREGGSRGPLRQKIMIAVGAGAVALAVAAGVALSLGSGTEDSDAQASPPPPAVEAPAPAQTAAPVAATAMEAPAPVETAAPAGSASAEPLASAAPAAGTAAPRSTGGANVPRPEAFSDPFGRSRK
jgi:serine/threonine-protein kinase